MATSTVTETSRNKNNIPVPIPVPSRYEAQKSRDWYTFGQFLKNHSPPVSMSSCNGSHVIEFLGHLDHLGKTKVHTPICPYFGHPNPPAPCSCPIRQAWGSLDSLIGRLRAAYEEHGGSAETNPFAARAVQLYLREVREWQEKSRGIVKKREPNPLPLVLQPRPGVTVPALVPRYFKMDAVPLSAPAVVRVGAVPTPYPFRNRLPRGGSVNAGQGKGNSDKERELNTTTTATTNAAVTATVNAATVTAAVASSTTVAAAASATTTAATAVTSTAAVIAPTTTDAVVTTTTKRSSSDTQTLQNDRRTRVRRGNKK